ncbi:hypothetical protein [Pontibacter flavimaris]|uniref:Uncharacterized protein n=1 Tax=Pontibacter flavimaris TaxID=1797110 RepID=A0A1Q5PHZ1_9BACT|nr:hypothetical protein [Pontibacter flavimaris]OKL41826.1 hypothetical protein A3841_07330 [Pontibacter flavimaris]
MMHTATQLPEIYTSEAGAVYQCDRHNRLMLSFAGKLTVLKLDAFLRLKHAVDRIDLEAMASNPDRSFDFSIITLCGCDRCFVLTLPELHALKELLAGAKFVLELNRMLHECLALTTV